VLDPFQTLSRAVEDSETLLELAEGSLDTESLTEIHTNLVSAATLLRELELRQMLSGETDANDCYLTVHAGAGGTEACDWAGILARMYRRYAEIRGYKTSVIDFTDGDGAGYRSITFEVSGSFAYGYLKAEVGVHRLVRISPFDSNARRHTSFASVFAYPIVDDTIEINIRSEDLRVDTYRAGGAGGQHVNKTDSAVRMTHIPSGIVVQCQAERSQIQNREKAMKMLRARLYEVELQKRQAEADAMHATKKENSWGSQIRNYVMQPYQLIKDVRTGVETNTIQKVLDGDLQEFIEAYLMGKVNSKTSDGEADL
jgi:peptide chain release factor 2